MNGTDNTDTNASTTEAARRSPGLALFALLGLAVAAWGLADGPTLPDLATLGWIAVAVGAIAGLVLIVSGARSARR
ncbi:hypothetical protein GYA93_05485 [Gordonia desulfuricans]|uniref:Uncharacterized protein n=1 Tax=Gordonia desulfuricans TaxID=89051 RepID=A0A7K3LL98_9ACTN|nr:MULTISPECIES: hypothetical protein [Gordonia]KOY49412.1 hypothetical protein ISGA_10480 [Gordonia sp. NB41Y]NDK89035.1 hypothetical protein [Gordonia desulfuricans]WLP91575.1 hypothetical protein Q9K23_04780 [Gordonia sp. NB41Y]